MTKKEVVFACPLADFFRINVTMHGGVIQYDKARLVDVRMPFRQIVDESDDVSAGDASFVQGVRQRIGAVVKRAQHIHSTARNARVRRVRQAFRRPCPLYVGHGGHAGFIHEKQLEFSLLRRLLQLFERRLRRYEVRFVSLFFNDSRQRLKLKPRFFNPAASRSSLNGGASG